MTQLARARYRSKNWSNVLTSHSPLLTLTRLKWLRTAAVLTILSALAASHAAAYTVTASVNVNSTLAVMPEYSQVNTKDE